MRYNKFITGEFITAELWNQCLIGESGPELVINGGASLPTATRCDHCGTPWRPNRFHPGSCDECGAPKPIAAR